jgi:hypothetical protein
VNVRAVIRLTPVLVAFALVHSCFEETSSDDENECPVGSEGCDCYGNGTCDGDLVCTDGKCFQPDCTPGEELCQCVDGQCFGDLECVDGVCRQPSGDDGGADDDGGTDDDGGDPDDGGTTGGDDGGTDDPPPDCDPLPGDTECITCLKAECCERLVECMKDSHCACFYECLATEQDPSTCNCLPSDVFMELSICMYEMCPVCDSTGCGVPDHAPWCTHCAGEFCCPELQACWNSQDCTCVEQCSAAGILVEICIDECGAQADQLSYFWELRSCAHDGGCMDEAGGVCYP